MKRLQGACILVVVLAGLPSIGSSQETRRDLLDQSIGLSQEQRFPLLMRAADPNLGPLDATWAEAVHSVAVDLLRVEDGSDAEVWLRWGARHGSDWPMEEPAFRPAVVERYGIARLEVEDTRSLEDSWASTSWVWAEDLDVDAEGRLEVALSGGTTAVAVSIEGVGALPGDGSLTPGTYTVRVQATGYEEAELTREVLPGVTTLVSIELPPLLAAETQVLVSQKLVQIVYADGGVEVCRNGVLNQRGLVLTTLSGLPEAGSVAVVSEGVRYESVQVLERDPSRDAAVLDLGTGNSTPLALADSLEPGTYVWGVFNQGCAVADPARTQLGEMAGSLVRLSDPLPAQALGSPVVDSQGAFVGMAMANDQIAPWDSLQEMVNRAILALDDRVQARSSGGPPWALIGGAGAAGALALALLGGDDGATPSTTGDFEITIPVGGS